MTIEKVINWYEQNVNYKLTKSFLNFMIKIGIIKDDIDLDFLNLFLLEKENNEFMKNGGKFILKQNRIDAISKFNDENKINEPKVNSSAKKTGTKKFKIEKLNGNKLKLVKA